MSKGKLRSRDLKGIDFPSDVAKSLAMSILYTNFKHQNKQTQLSRLKQVIADPLKYIDDPIFGALVAHYPETQPEEDLSDVVDYHDRIWKEDRHFELFGSDNIADNAIDQMRQAMTLPVATAGALMPDAHHGYGLPIGGVLACDNAVIPYGVGLDIGCRMSMTLYDIHPNFIGQQPTKLKRALQENTWFGAGSKQKVFYDHEILEDKRFEETYLLKKLRGLAIKQLGSSGSGNHFVEFGIVEITDKTYQVPPGQYVAILAHSGSRALGANIANHYTEVAAYKCRLPKQVQRLAWLDMNSADGQEYWLSMNLAGDFAKACHDVIHQNLAKAMGWKPIAKIENHHNFAWKENIDGIERIVHRKGATPAHQDELGIIPGSMTAAGYIVRGKGEPTALNSASHGAGRKLSRSKARVSITQSSLNRMLSDHGVTLIGGGLDEAPIAYKNIEKVIGSQQNLVDVIGKFTPKIVRMDKK